MNRKLGLFKFNREPAVQVIIRLCNFYHVGHRRLRNDFQAFLLPPCVSLVRYTFTKLIFP